MPPPACGRKPATVDETPAPPTPRHHEVLRVGAGAHGSRLRGSARRGYGARRRQRGRQDHARRVRRGTYLPDSGEILFEGKVFDIQGPKDSAKLGIEVVYQDLALCDNLDVVQNMYLGREEHDGFWRLKEPTMDNTAETLKSLAVTTINRPGSRRHALGRTAADGRGRQGRAIELEARDPRRANRRARGRPDRQVLALVRRLAEQGLRRPHLAQPARRLRDSDRITVFRLGRDVGVFQGEKTTQQEVVHAITAGMPTKFTGISATARGSRRDRSNRDRRAAPRRTPQGDRTRAQEGDLAASGGKRKSGTSASCRSSSASSFIVVFFSFKATNFFTADKFNNVIIQSAGTAMLAYGVVFVLLLGEIDLWISYLEVSRRSPSRSSSCPAGAGGAQVVARRQGAARHRHRDRVCAALGVAQGGDRRDGRRPLVRRHARRSPRLPGRDPAVARGRRHDDHRGQLDQRHRQLLLRRTRTGWLIAAIITGFYALVVCSGGVIGHRRARHCGPRESSRCVVAQIDRGRRSLAFGGVVAICNHGDNHAMPHGLPLAGVLVVVALVVLRLLSSGPGSGVTSMPSAAMPRPPDASGINVPGIRILFFIPRAPWRVAGILSPRRQLGRPQLSAAGRCCLNSIAAAVIGGVSLFGGRGEVRRAGFLGALVIATVSNGLNTAGDATGVIYVVTGVILLLRRHARHDRPASADARRSLSPKKKNFGGGF